MKRGNRLTVVLLLGATLTAAITTAASATAWRAVGAGPFDGRWTASITRAQLQRAGADATLAAKLSGAYTARWANGSVRFHNLRTRMVTRGRFTVRGNVVRTVFLSGIGVRPGDVSQCRWSVYRDRLTFKRIHGRPSLLCEAGVWVRAG